MNKKNKVPELSKAEYDILRILWKNGKQTVREVHTQLNSINGWAYTTTKTMMDRMVAKKFLSRGTFHGIFLYRPLITRPAGLARFIQFFADRILEMDTNTIVAMFSQNKSITKEEIHELECLLRDLQKKRDKKKER
jgi:predicted transcriptional regulator